MHIVDAIFDRFGKTPIKVLSDETGLAAQTVHSWKVGGNIPAWRRASVLDAARRQNICLEPNMLAYLASQDRAPRKEEAA